MQMACVDNDMVVALRYVMRNGKGDVLEDIMQASPVNYLHGSTGILPLLQTTVERFKGWR
jgi:FKBP-type peptidyl-prolyl cis-trans isomerase 2